MTASLVIHFVNPLEVYSDLDFWMWEEPKFQSFSEDESLNFILKASVVFWLARNWASVAGQLPCCLCDDTCRGLPICLNVNFVSPSLALLGYLLSYTNTN